MIIVTVNIVLRAFVSILLLISSILTRGRHVVTVTLLSMRTDSMVGALWPFR